MPQIRLLPIGRIGGLPTVKIGINGVFTTLAVDQVITVSDAILAAVEEAGFSYLTGGNLFAEYPPYSAVESLIASVQADRASGAYKGGRGDDGRPATLTAITVNSLPPGSVASSSFEATGNGGYALTLNVPQAQPAPAVGPYTHSQATPSTTWTINHNLGFKPVIQSVTTGGRLMRGVVDHVSENQAVIAFNTPVAGQAIAR